jgi:hypothetical protein
MLRVPQVGDGTPVVVFILDAGHAVLRVAVDAVVSDNGLFCVKTFHTVLPDTTSAKLSMGLGDDDSVTSEICVCHIFTDRATAESTLTAVGDTSFLAVYSTYCTMGK